MVYRVDEGVPHYFPFMNYSVSNPDGDIQFQWGFVYSLTSPIDSLVFLEPLLQALPPMKVVHPNVQGAGFGQTVAVSTVREYSELSASGWNVDYSTLKNPYDTESPLAQWHQTCFDLNGVFTTIGNPQCKFSVLPEDLEFLDR